MKQTLMALALLGLGFGAAPASANTTVLDSGPMGIGGENVVRLLFKATPLDLDGPGSPGVCNVRYHVRAFNGAALKSGLINLVPGAAQAVEIDVVKSSGPYAANGLTQSNNLLRWYFGTRAWVNAPGVQTAPNSLAGDEQCARAVSASIEILRRDTGEVVQTRDLGRVL